IFGAQKFSPGRIRADAARGPRSWGVLAPPAHVASLCPRLCPRPTHLRLASAMSSYARKQNPPVSSELTEGSLRALKLRRPMLYPTELRARQILTIHETEPMEPQVEFGSTSSRPPAQARARSIACRRWSGARWLYR